MQTTTRKSAGQGRAATGLLQVLDLTHACEVGLVILCSLYGGDKVGNDRCSFHKMYWKEPLCPWLHDTSL
jgi:hypothetical protein